MGAGGLPTQGFRAAIIGVAAYIGNGERIIRTNQAIATSTLGVASSSNIQGVSALNQSFANLGATTKQLPNQFAKAAFFLGRLQFVAISTIAALAVLGAPVIFAAQFEQTLALIVGLTDAPREAIQGLRDDILDLSAATARSPQELGTAAYFILSSGIDDVSTAFEVLEFSAQAAVAGLGDTENIARTTTAILNAYQLAAEDASRVTNILVGIVRLGAAEPEELAKSIGRVIPLAAQMGVEFSQVGAVLASMTNVGISTERAITGLIGIFSQLIRPTDRSRELFRALGFEINTFRQLVETDFVGAMNQLFGAIEGNEEIIAELFPDIRGLIGALAAFGKQGAETEEIQRRLASGFNFLDAAVQEATETTAFAFRKALNDIRIAMIQLGTGALPAFRSFFEGISRAIASATRGARAFQEEFGSTFTSLGRNLRTLIDDATRVVGAVTKIFTAFQGDIALTKTLGFLIKQLDLIIPALITFGVVLAGGRIISSLAAIRIGLIAATANLRIFIASLIHYTVTQNVATAAAFAFSAIVPTLTVGLGVAAAAFVATRFLISRFTGSADDATESVRAFTKEAAKLRAPFIQLGLSEEEAGFAAAAEDLIEFQKGLDEARERTALLQEQSRELNDAFLRAPTDRELQALLLQTRNELILAKVDADVFQKSIDGILQKFSDIEGDARRLGIAEALEEAGVPTEQLRSLFEDLDEITLALGIDANSTFSEIGASLQTPIDQAEELNDQLDNVLSAFGALRDRLEGVAGVETQEEASLRAELTAIELVRIETEQLALADGVLTDAEKLSLDTIDNVSDQRQLQIDLLQKQRDLVVDNTVALNSGLLPSEQQLLDILIGANTGFNDQTLVLENLNTALDAARDAHIIPLIILYETLIATLEKKVVTKVDTQQVDVATQKVNALFSEWIAFVQFTDANTAILRAQVNVQGAVDPADVASNVAADIAAAIAAATDAISTTPFVPSGGGTAGAEKNPFQDFINADQAREVILEIAKTGEITWRQVGRLWSLGFKDAADQLAAIIRGEADNLEEVLSKAFKDAGAEGMSQLVGEILDGTLSALLAMDLLEAGMVESAKAILGIMTDLANNTERKLEIITEAIREGVTIQQANELLELGFNEEALDFLAFLNGLPSDIGGDVRKFLGRFERGSSPVPLFHEGGFVPRGVTTPAILRGPEAVIPVSGMSQLQSLTRSLAGLSGGSEGITSYGSLQINFGAGDEGMESLVMRSIGA